MDLQDLHPVRVAWDADLDLPVEASGSSKRRIDGVGTVGRADHDDLTPLRNAVEHGQKLGNDAAFHLAVHVFPFRGDGIELVDEDDRRSILFGFFEDFAQFLFGLAVVFGDDLRAGDRDEVGAAFICHGFGDQGLAGPRRSVEENALWRLDPQRLEEFGMAERQFDHFADAAQLALKAADVFVGYRLGAGESFLFFEDEFGVFRENAGVFRLDLRHFQFDRRARVVCFDRDDIAERDGEVD